MKTIQQMPIPEARTVVLIVGAAIGLGIAVHEIFFVGAALALVVSVEWAIRAARECGKQAKLVHCYPGG